jgi:hypothetical protein
MRCFQNVQETNGDRLAPCPHISNLEPQDRFLNKKFWKQGERYKYSRRVDKVKNNGKRERRFIVGM